MPGLIRPGQTWDISEIWAATRHGAHRPRPDRGARALLTPPPRRAAGRIL